MHGGKGGGVAQGGGHLGKVRHLGLRTVQTAPAQTQCLGGKGMVLVRRTKGSGMNYRPERLPPKFRHPFACLMHAHRAKDNDPVSRVEGLRASQLTCD